MEDKKSIVRPLRGAMTNDDYLHLGTLLLKAGYTVQIKSQVIPGKQTKEKVVVYWEEK